MLEYRFRILDDAAIERIHRTSLRVLSEIGFSVANAELCALLCRQGLAVDDDLVRLPTEVVEWALCTAPRAFSLHGRNGDELPLRQKQTYPLTYQNALKVLDYGAPSLRTATENDLEQFVRLGDAMPDVRIVGPVCWPQDLPAPLQAVYAARDVMTATAKHNRCSPHNLDEARVWVEMAEIASRGLDLSQRPTIHFGLSPTSPLQLGDDPAQVLLYLARKGLPVCVTACPMAGGTSPYTLAGTLMQANAEHLFMLTVAQLVREGTPIILGGAAGVINMRTGSLSYGSPERHLILGAAVELAEYYDLPHHSPSGSVDAVLPDVQSGSEKMATWVTRLLENVELGLFFGSLATGLAVSLEQMVIDADLLRASQRLLAGLRVDDDTLGFDAVRRAGPGGSFLADEHTLRWLRGTDSQSAPEFSWSRLANRDGAQGSAMLERAHAEVERLLSAWKPSVPDAVVEDLRRYADQLARQIRRRAGDV